jgi:hypothetical protein
MPRRGIMSAVSGIKIIFLVGGFLSKEVEVAYPLFHEI